MVIYAPSGEKVNAVTIGAVVASPFKDVDPLDGVEEALESNVRNELRLDMPDVYWDITRFDCDEDIDTGARTGWSIGIFGVSILVDVTSFKYVRDVVGLLGDVEKCLNGLPSMTCERVNFKDMDIGDRLVSSQNGPLKVIDG